MADGHSFRIACYGWIDADAGSSLSGAFLVVAELLRRGHVIDFYRSTTTNDPSGALPPEVRPRFHSVEVSPSFRYRDLLPKWLGPSAHDLMGQLEYALMMRAIRRCVCNNHRRNPYDFSLFLGRPADFVIRGIPVVAWPQGAPQTELEALWRHRRELQRVSGWWLASKVIVFKFVKTLLASRLYRRAEVVICGSQWTRSRILEIAAPPQSVVALPYPIDMERWVPEPRKFDGDVPLRLLWLGRIEPRKRFPLIVDAVDLLLREGHDVFLTVVGSWSFTPGYREIADSFAWPDRILIKTAVPRSQVPSLIKSYDILVQPSENEDFGSSVAEALCVGVPVVIGPTNGTGDYISGSSEIFKEYTARSVADAIVSVKRRLTESAHLVSWDCRATAENNFAVGPIVDELETLLLQVTGSRIAE